MSVLPGSPHEPGYERPVVRRGNAAGFPQVKGKCPACGWTSLFLGSGGYVTCANLDCPNPDTMDAFAKSQAEAVSA